MRTGLCHVISETSEDRFGETSNLEEAVRIARSVARKERPGEPISIEHRGKVIRQLVLMAGGDVKDEIVV
jgi:hypothetical protein